MTGLPLRPVTHLREAGTSCCDNTGMKTAEWTKATKKGIEMHLHVKGGKTTFFLDYLCR